MRWARELQERYPPDPDAPTGAPAVIRNGRSELYPVIDRALLEAAALDEEQIQLVRDLQMHSVMVVPLLARGRTLGAITFVWAESGRQYSTRELELAEELGRRAGLALDHARLYAREHATAETLSARCCPRRCPRSTAASWSCATSRATRATTPAATGTTRSRSRTAASGS